MYLYFVTRLPEESQFSDRNMWELRSVYNVHVYVHLLVLITYPTALSKDLLIEKKNF
jgi:hypothetical protein